MNAICYENTKTNLPGWVSTVHIEQKYGYAYETDTHFIHLYGKEAYYIISQGLTVVESKDGYTDIYEWIDNRFGAISIREMKNKVGHTVNGIWRPALYYWEDTCNAININKDEQISQENSIRILIQDLDNLLLYIEPSSEGLETFGHKTRELLILACTEVENQWSAFLKESGYSAPGPRGYTTNDYINILNYLFLNDFSINLKNKFYKQNITPFYTWSTSNPTTSLSWYDAYNKTKHDRSMYFNQAKLKYVIDAIAANIILYAARFSPLTLINNTNLFSSIVNQMFEIKMINSDITSFYIPEINTSQITCKDCFVFDSYREKLTKPWIIDSIVY